MCNCGEPKEWSNLHYSTEGPGWRAMRQPIFNRTGYFLAKSEKTKSDGKPVSMFAKIATIHNVKTGWYWARFLCDRRWPSLAASAVALVHKDHTGAKDSVKGWEPFSHSPETTLAASPSRPIVISSRFEDISSGQGTADSIQWKTFQSGKGVLVKCEGLEQETNLPIYLKRSHGLVVGLLIPLVEP